MATKAPPTPRPARSAIEIQPLRQRHNRRNELAIWWREIDRTLLVLVLVLMAIGTAAVAAASPASARRLSTSKIRLDDLHFFTIHLRWQLLGLIAMFGTSMFIRRERLSLRQLGLVK